MAKDGRINHTSKVPALFKAQEFINNPLYLQDNSTLYIGEHFIQRQAGIEFVQKLILETYSDSNRSNIMYIKPLSQTVKRGDLFVDYGPSSL